MWRKLIKHPLASKRRLFTVAAVLIVVGLLIYSGYWLANRKATKTEASLRTQISSLKNENSALGGQSSTPAASSSNYFVVLQPYGVKFPYSPSSGELVYSTDGSNISFDSGALQSIAQADDPSSKCDPGTGSLGVLSRSLSAAPTNASDTSDGNVAHLGNYYYIYTSPQTDCSSNGDVIQEQNTEINTLIQDLKSLVIN